MYQMTHGFEGDSQTGYWLFQDESGKQVRKLSGREAALLSLLLGGHELPAGMHPLAVLGLRPDAVST